MNSEKSFLFLSAKLIAAIPVVALLCGPTRGLATPLLGPDLGNFAVLGASTVTNTGVTTIAGNVGVSPGAAITGTGSIALTGTYHTGSDVVAATGQNQLATALVNLGSLGPGTLESADLAGLVLLPGIYTVPAGVSNLTGILTLDGNGNTNAAWVFLLPGTLITSAGSAINVINTGAGAGIYWDVGSSATLNTATTFEGNILAAASVTLDTGATIGCGRALAKTGAVTLDSNAINATDCLGTAGAGSNGFSGGLDVVGSTVSILPASAAPEPGSLALLGGALGLLTLTLWRRSRFALPGRFGAVPPACVEWPASPI